MGCTSAVQINSTTATDVNCVIPTHSLTHIETKKKVLWITFMWMWRYASQYFALFFTTSEWHCNYRHSYKFSSWYSCSVGDEFFLIHYNKPYPSWLYLIWVVFRKAKTILRIRIAVHYYVLKSVSCIVCPSINEARRHIVTWGESDTQ